MKNMFTSSKQQMRLKAFHHVLLPSIWHISRHPGCQSTGRRTRPYHLTDWNRTRVLNVFRGTRVTLGLACNKRREGASQDTQTGPRQPRHTSHQHITSAIHWPAPKCPCFTQQPSSIHCLVKRASLIFGGGGGRRESGRGWRTGDQVTSHIPCFASVRLCRSQPPPLTN